MSKGFPPSAKKNAKEKEVRRDTGQCQAALPHAWRALLVVLATSRRAKTSTWAMNVARFLELGTPFHLGSSETKRKIEIGFGAPPNLTHAHM